LDEKVNPLEEVDESIVTLRNVPHSLIIGYQTHDKGQREEHTPRRTPIPVKIVLAGENA
jgi:hypothetical protein